MGLLQKGVSILHFDETYYFQKELQSHPHENLDFQQLERVNLFCDEHSFSKIRRRLQKRENRGITYIGSGNYHYVTYALLQEMTQPFTLVLFDNHPDLGLDEREEPPFSCGSWVYYALRDLPMLKKAIIIGPTYEKLRSHPLASIYPYDGIQHDTIHSILQEIPTNEIYISIDKDVLRKEDAITNWDQGKMSLAELVQNLTYLLKAKDVVGVDVCGELRVSSADFHRHDQLIQVNDHANVQILQACLKHVEYRHIGA